MQPLYSPEMNDTLHITRWASIRKEQVMLNGTAQFVPENFVTFADFIKSLYKKRETGYPKFYKMDNLGKLGFLTAEIVLSNSRWQDHYAKEEFGVVMFNSSSSLDTDYLYQETIRDKNNYFPSPSVFVYTLPNIMIGEICIRHRINGENFFLVTKKFDPAAMIDIVSLMSEQEKIRACLCGWVEFMDDRFESFMFIAEKGSALKERNENPEDYETITTESLIQRYFQNR